MSPAKKWPDDVKATALDVFAREGCPAASKATGVPEGTIRSWAKREGERAGTRLAQRNGVEVDVVRSASVVPWRDRREPLVRDLGDAVVETLDEVRTAVKGGRLRDARDGAVTLGILVDKAQLLSGLATGRSESLSMSLGGSELARKIAELEQELGYS